MLIHDVDVAGDGTDVIATYGLKTSGVIVKAAIICAVGLTHTCCGGTRGAVRCRPRMSIQISRASCELGAWQSWWSS